MEQIGIAYVSLAEADWDNAPELPITFRLAVREAFSGLLMYAGKYSGERADKVLNADWGDLIGFGRWFIANPDLPARLLNHWPLNELDASSLYGGTAAGYSDYPRYRPSL